MAAVRKDAEDKPKRTSVLFVRGPNADTEAPDTYLYRGLPEDALFGFVFQTLGYSVVLVDHDDDATISARPM